MKLKKAPVTEGRDDGERANELLPEMRASPKMAAPPIDRSGSLRKRLKKEAE